MQDKIEGGEFETVSYEPADRGRWTIFHNDLLGGVDHTFRVRPFTQKQQNAAWSDPRVYHKLPSAPEVIDAYAVTIGGRTGNCIRVEWHPPSNQAPGTVARYVMTVKYLNVPSCGCDKYWHSGNIHDTVFTFASGYTAQEMEIWIKACEGYCGDASIPERVTSGFIVDHSCLSVPIGDPEEKLTTLDDVSIPEVFELSQNFPNPFNPTTTLSFALPAAQSVSLEIYNIIGQRVTTLVKEELPAGNHTVQWDGTNESGQVVASGMYFARFRAGEFAANRKMVILK